MTLLRTALRLVAVSALTGDAQSRPTIAENRIYDSRIADVQPETFAEDAKALIIVTTDQDEGEQLSQNNGGPPFKRWVDLTLEMAMAARVKEGEQYVIISPDTDSRLEASLDLLEYQAIRRLSYDLAAPAALFRSIARIRKSECHRQVDETTGIKMAVRILTLQCDCGDDDDQVYNASGELPAGLNVLPDPLRSVAQSLPAGSSGLDVCQAIAAILDPLTAPPLEGVDFKVDASDGIAGVPRVHARAEFPGD